MHVLILPSWYFPLGSQEIGGRMFHHLADGLRVKEIDAHILYSNYSTKGNLFRKEHDALEEGVSTYRYSQFFPPKVNKSLIAWWRKKCVNDILNYIEKAGKPDVIHAHSYLAASVASALQKKVTIPFVYTERLSSFMTDTLPSLHYYLILESCASATKITGVSPGMKQCLQKITRQPIEVVPNFYDPKVFYHDSEIEKFGSFTWVSIGEPAHVKGLDILFHSFAELKIRMHERPMQLILIDRIPEETELRKLAKRLKIEDDIVWKGLLDQEALAFVMRKSHALVSASRTETFGKAIVEAQACGLPVVVTKTDGANYIMTGSDQGEQAEIENAESLVVAMQKVMQKHTSYHPAMIEAKVKDRFNKEKIIDQWIELYKSLLA